MVSMIQNEVSFRSPVAINIPRNYTGPEHGPSMCINYNFNVLKNKDTLGTFRQTLSGEYIIVSANVLYFLIVVWFKNKR